MQAKCDSKKINVKSTTAVVAELAFRTAKKETIRDSTNEQSIEKAVTVEPIEN